MSVERVQIEVTASGTAGNAEGTAYSPHVAGEVLKVALEYSAGAAASTDVVIDDDNDPNGDYILCEVNNNTSKNYYPRHLLMDDQESHLTYDGTHKVYGPMPVCGPIRLAIVGANDGDSVTATVWLRT